jgi:Skp family chaperone for outer membrane proteins
LIILKKVSIYIFIIFLVHIFAYPVLCQQGKSKTDKSKPKTEQAKPKAEENKPKTDESKSKPPEGNAPEGEGSLKVATVNIEMLVKNSLAYKAADLEWSRELAKKQEGIEQKSKELETLQKKLDSLDGEGLKDRNKIESDIEQLKLDIKYLINDNKKELSTKEKGFFDEISKDIIKVVEEYGKANNFDYIVNESSVLVLFTDTNLDITAEMLIRYNNYWESKKNTSAPAAAPAKK